MALTKISTGMISEAVGSVDLNIDANTMFIDVSTNRVGINNNSPAVPLDVTGAVNMSSPLTIATDHMVVDASGDVQLTADSDVRLTIGSEGTVGNNSSNWIRADETQMRFNNACGGYLFENTGTAALTIDSSRNATFAGTLGVTGVISPTTHIDMPDSAKIKLGTGDDLEIYHDGSNSFISEGGTG